MKPKRDRNGAGGDRKRHRNETRWIHEFYSRVRTRGRCRDCASSQVQIGRHPEGRSVGEVVRVFRGDREGLKTWIRTCGWQCPRCRNRGGGGGAPPPSDVLVRRGVEKERERERRQRVDQVRKKLALIKRILTPFRKRTRKAGGPITQEMCQMYYEKRLMMGWSEERARTENAGGPGSYMDPDKYKELEEQEAALFQELNVIC